VTLAIAAPSEPSLEEYWPDIAELAHQATVTDEAMPPGMFFDLATIHVLTTATLNRLRELYPQGPRGQALPAQHRRASRER
jgi:uncharacterized protein